MNQLLRIFRLPERAIYRLKRMGLGHYRVGRVLIDTALLPYDLHTVMTTYRQTFGQFPRLLSPHGFSEQLQRSKIFGRKSIHTLYADKLKVRNLVAQKIGSNHLVPLLWHGTDLRDAPWADLPQAFVIKANHGSGTNILVHDKDSFDRDKAINLTNRWLRYYEHSRWTAEWQYRHIPPRLLIEAMLPTPDGNTLIDHRFFCFHGRVFCVQVDTNRDGINHRDFFDRAFTPLPVVYTNNPPYTGQITRPACFDEMVKLAEKLAADEPFVRVDLYDCAKPMFAELTLHPRSGILSFSTRRIST